MAGLRRGCHRERRHHSSRAAPATCGTQHGRQPLGRLRGRRLRGRHGRRGKLGCNGRLQGPEGGGLLAGLRHRGGRRRHGELGPRRTWTRSTSPSDRRTARTSARPATSGIIGWYVPPWLAKAHPDILDWQNLNKYAEEFKTSESGGKGQFLDGDPSYVTNDEALVKNLEPRLQGRLRGQRGRAHPGVPQGRAAARTWVIGYFYSRSGSSPRCRCRRSKLPPYTPGCDADAGQGGLRLPGLQAQQDRQHEVRQVGQPGLRPGQELPLDQRTTRTTSSKLIAVEKMSPEDAAAEVDRRQSRQGGRLDEGHRLTVVGAGRVVRRPDGPVGERHGDRIVPDRHHRSARTGQVRSVPL